MRQVLLIAARDYRQYAATRTFWISMAVVPAILLIGTVFAAISMPPPPRSAAIVLYDAGGHVAGRATAAIETAQQKVLLRRFSAYLHHAGLKPPPMLLALGPWPQGARPLFNDAQAAAFARAGGIDAALAELNPTLPADAPRFNPPQPPFRVVRPPAPGPNAASDPALRATLRAWLRDGAPWHGERIPVAAAAIIPADIGAPGATLTVLMPEGQGAEAADLVQRAIRGALAPEPAPDLTTLVETQAGPPPIRPAGAVLSIAIAYLLLIASAMTGAMLLQAVVEERSGKLMEMLLASVSASELMAGKLLGGMAVGLTIAAVWIGCAALGLAALPPGFLPAAALVPSWIQIGAGGAFFLLGFTMTATIYLAIGSLVETLQDAQGYLMPVLMATFLPAMFGLSQALTQPHSALPAILSWIPPLTPVVMLARVGNGASNVAVIGSLLLLALFVAAEIWLMARVFRANLLRTGQPPSVWRLLREAFA